MQTSKFCSAKAETLVSALEQYGQGDYIGESISQLEHCLQAAHQASKSGNDTTRYEHIQV
jgi:predicted HD phosphohydrolase